MSVTIKIVVEDIADRLLTFDTIELERSDTVKGSYSQVATTALVEGQYYYSIADSGGDLNKWYRYRFHKDPATNSAYSDLFRVDGVTRLRGRQAALAKYGAGIVMVNTGTVAAKVVTSDYRFKTTLFRTDRGKGTWLLVATGARAGDTRLIKSSSPTDGDIDVSPDFGGNLADGDEIEWHWLADPKVWDDALNRGMARYWYVEKVPLAGVAGQEEYDLTGIPFLRDKEHVHDVRWYPTSGVDVDESFGVDGRWWGIREDVGVLTLQIHPAIEDDKLLYLETTRPMSPLYTDASAAPANASEDLVAALAYDEVLAYLSAPGRGSLDARQTWRVARAAHASELHRLLIEHRPKPRHGQPQSPWPPVVPQPWSAR